VCDWWDAYTAAHADANNITLQEFQENFRAHHIPSGIMKLKKKEFLSLTQETCPLVNTVITSLSFHVKHQKKWTLMKSAKSISWKA
jgi:4-hydroxy-3-methylbut-2-enyl diphosphate reductase IspH